MRPAIVDLPEKLVNDVVGQSFATRVQEVFSLQHSSISASRRSRRSTLLLQCGIRYTVPVIRADRSKDPAGPDW